MDEQLHGASDAALEAALHELGGWVDFPVTRPSGRDLAASVRLAIEVEQARRLVTEFRGRVGEDYYQKILGDRTTLEPVVVAGRPGYWLSGDPHVLAYVDQDGRLVEETRRPVGDALVWEAGGVTFRVESALGREATLAIAAGIVTGD